MYPYESVPRVFAAELALFCFGATILSVRLAKNRPTVLDSVVLTFFVFAALSEALFVGSSIPVPLIFGFAALLVAWCVHYWEAASA